MPSEPDPFGLDRKDESGRLLVACDEWCAALREPETLEEVKAALEHWQDHGFLGGCSHGS